MTDRGAVLVTGVTGTVGSDVARELVAAGLRVRGGVRDPSQAVVPHGAEAVRFDFRDPATVSSALAGVDRIFLMRPPAISDIGAALGPLIAQAAERQVRHMVVLSVMGVNPALPHWRMERLVLRSGIPMTALRPSYFAQNLLTAFGDDIRLRSRLSLAAGRGRVSFVDTRDVAAVAAAVLADPDAFAAGPVTLTGPAALDFTQVASALTAALGRTIAYQPQTFVQRRRDLLALGLPPAYVRVQLVIDATTRLGLASKTTAGIATVLGRAPIDLPTFITDHRQAWL